MKIILKVLLVSTLFVGVGCGTSAGIMRDGITHVVIKEANFKYVKKNVRGFAKSKKPNALLVKDAYADLMQNANLGPNQTIVNVREDIKTAIFYGRHLLLTADVIEFSNGGGAAPVAAPVVEGDMTSVDGGVISSEDAPEQKKKKNLGDK